MQTIVPNRLRCAQLNVIMAHMTLKKKPDGVNEGTNPSIHFGKQVKKERMRQGWTLRDLADKTGIDPAQLSRVERGIVPPSERVATAMDEVFRHRHGWFSEFRGDYQQWAPPGYRHLADYESQAGTMRLWVPGIVNGIAQTEDYARALIATTPDVSREVIDRRVAARMERQRRVLDRDSPPEAWLLVDEPALFRLVGSPEIMARQLDRLLELSARPGFTVQVVPTVGHAAATSEIIVLDNDAAYSEHTGQGFTYTDEETVTRFARMLAKLQGEGYRVSESVRVVEGMRDIWRRGESPLTPLLTEVRA